MHQRLGAVVTLVLAALLAGCGGGSPSAVRPGTTSSATSVPPRSTSTSVTTTTPTTTPATTSSSGEQQPRITITPSRKLRSGQSVNIVGTGFSAFEALAVTECANKGTKTTSGDCNLNELVQITSDAHGRVALSFVARKGPFGANHIVCGSTQSCLISVTQPVPAPTQEADAPITFR